MSKWEKEQLKALVGLLRARAVKMAEKSSANDDKKSWFQAGRAEGEGWAADHLETLVNQFRAEKSDE